LDKTISKSQGAEKGKMSKDNANDARMGIVGAAIVPHAPQLLSMPDTEDLDQVARVKAKMEQIGDEIRALEADLIVIISNCHGEELAVDCVPAFMIHCGDRAEGAGKHNGAWRIDGDSGQELTALLLEEGFDPAFTFSTDVGTAFTIAHEYCGFSREIPFLPIFVNVYVPPQPSPQRCFAFGKALSRCFERMKRRVAVIVSGGLSHYPATPMYPTPDLATDQVIFERLAAGNLLYLMSFDAKALDTTGNVESRSLQIMAGCIGDRKPDHAILEPSWHHIYAVLGWTSTCATEKYVPLYPGFTARHSGLARAINKIVHDEIALTDYRRDRVAFASRFNLTPEQSAALVKLDEDDLRVNFSINPMLTYMAKLRVGDPLKHRRRLFQ
jgi:2,3-dihydroxyphenylpropionate 1,2-dioxygenase